VGSAEGPILEDGIPPRSSEPVGIGTVIIRNSRVEVERLQKTIFERNGKARPWTDQPVGTPEDVAEALTPLVEIGYRHLIAGFPAPFDEESMTRFATEVRPLLER